MYFLRTVSLVPQIEFLILLSNNSVFCGLVEANSNDPSQYEGDVLRKLFADAQLELNGKPPSPLEFANSINKVLQRWNLEEGRYQVVFYAGVLLQQSRAVVCTAGDIRVHLISNGHLRATTRDHNMIDDPPDDPDESLKSLQREFLLSVPTRCLDGTLNHRSPEIHTWKVERQSSVVICTSQFHRYLNPQIYLPSLPTVFGSHPDGAESGALSGAVVEIEWRE